MQQKMMQRRAFLTHGLTAAAALALPLPVFSASGPAQTARQALVESNLIYLSPIKAGGLLSRCQAEVWYVMLGADAYVVTRTDSWRARAPVAGVTQTKIWVGDLGVWKRANYQSLPSVNASASVETDSGRIDAVLEEFGRKYSSEWGTWGPRFRNGLKDGSRSVLRYQLS